MSQRVKDPDLKERTGELSLPEAGGGQVEVAF
jgi:hypothetical protein